MAMPTAVAPLAVTSLAGDESAGGMISLIVPVVRRADDLGAIYDAFAAALSPITPRYEFLFVVDGGFGPPPEALVARSQKDQRVRILRFMHSFGEPGKLAGYDPTVFPDPAPRSAPVAERRGRWGGRGGGSPVPTLGWVVQPRAVRRVSRSGPYRLR